MQATHFTDWTSAEELTKTVKERLLEPYVVQDSKPNVLDPDLLELLLEMYGDDESFSHESLKKFSISQILTYLQSTHKYYMQKKLPEIEQSLWHIFHRCDGAEKKNLSALAIFFNKYKQDLMEHIQMEEKGFFPYVWQLSHAWENNDRSADEIQAILALSPIPTFQEKHHSIEDELKEVAHILLEYTEGADLPLMFRVFLNQVQLFELELRKHALIEDHVLLPMVQEMERQMRTRLA